MMQPVLLGALFIGVLSALPIVNIANCCCVWILGGGVLAARLADDPDAAPLSPSRGAFVGLLAGVVGAFVWLAVAAPLEALTGPIQERLIADMLSDATDVPPEVRAWLETAGDGASASLRLGMGFVIQLTGGAMFSTLGGFLSAVFSRRRARAGADAVPPPAPPQ